MYVMRSGVSHCKQQSDEQQSGGQGGMDASGQAGMAEEEYQAAVAQTAELAAQLPRIGVVGRRPPQGPSMPQRLMNHFRSQEAVLGRYMLCCTTCTCTCIHHTPRGLVKPSSPALHLHAGEGTELYLLASAVHCAKMQGQQPC